MIGSMKWLRICVALMGGYVASAFAGCAGEEEPGSPCSKVGSRECGDGGVQFCGIQCRVGSDGLGGHCDNSPKWSRCVEDPVCMPGDEKDCGFPEGDMCEGFASDCILDLEDEGAPTFDSGDCFC